MKLRINTYLTIPFALLILIVTAGAAAGNIRVTKSYSEEYAANDEMLVRIENKYGQVNIETWDEPKVTIDVTVWAEASRRDRAQTILDAIEVTIEQRRGEIRAITNIDSRAMSSSGRIFSSNNNEFRIDYNVRMPKNLDLNLTHKYGDAFIDNLDGWVEIDLKYGNLKANNLSRGGNEPLNSLTLGYGNATIDKVNWIRMDIKYSNVTIPQGRAMVIVSKYSKYNISSVNSMVIESKYDNYTVGTTSNIVAESKYTNYRLNQVNKLLDIQTRYGDVRVNEIPATFESIRFEGDYASLHAPIHPSAAYSIDAEAQYGGLSYGSPNYTNRTDSSNSLKVSGTIGENRNPIAKVWIRVRYGSANLK